DFITKPFTIENITSVLNRVKIEPKIVKELGANYDRNLNFLNLALYKKYKSICTLQEISNELDELYDNKKIYERVVDLGKKLLCTKGSAFLLFEDGKVKVKRSDVFFDRFIGTQNGVLEEITFCAKDNRIFKKVFPDFRQSLGNSELIFAPLTLNNEIFGGLVFLNKDDGSGFNEEDFALAMTFAKKVSLRIENNALYEV
ncbi:MAG: hypothetical protein N2202_10325, partial [Proteobacteria bacterium]|nr:hypothetical protein [Pseudomonadota bacterium]